MFRSFVKLPTYLLGSIYNLIFLLSLQVDIVCHGETPISPDVDGGDPYAEPKKQNKFKTVKSGNSLTTEKLVQRIVERRLDYENRNSKKEAKEKAAYEAYMKSKQ